MPLSGRCGIGRAGRRSASWSRHRGFVPSSRRSSLTTGRPSRSRGGCVALFPDDAELQVSHETIYLSLFVQARGALREELTAHLRSKRKIRRGEKVTEKGQGEGQIVSAGLNIQRPAGAGEPRGPRE